MMEGEEYLVRRIHTPSRTIKRIVQEKGAVVMGPSQPVSQPILRQ